MLLEVAKHGDKSMTKVIDVTCSAITSIYTCVNSSLPIIQERAIGKRLSNLHNQYRLQKKAGYTGKKKDEFTSNLQKIFDIIKCKCEIKNCLENSCVPECSQKVHVLCSCPKDSKIPTEELFYIYSERNREKGRSDFVLGGHDKVTEAKITDKINRKEKANARKEREHEYLEKGKNIMAEPILQDVDNVWQDIGQEESCSIDQDFEFPKQSAKKIKLCVKKEKTKKFNTTKLNNTAKEAVRWGVSPKAAAAIANAVLTDYKVT